MVLALPLILQQMADLAAAEARVEMAPAGGAGGGGGYSGGGGSKNENNTYGGGGGSYYSSGLNINRITTVNANSGPGTVSITKV